jgi:hypothetical protein
MRVRSAANREEIAKKAEMLPIAFSSSAGHGRYVWRDDGFFCRRRKAFHYPKLL